MDIELAAHNYISTPEIDITLELALKLNRPILIEGPAGTGKTSVAIAISKALEWPLFRIQCYEGVTFESVIGEFDYKRQLLHIELVKQKQSPMNQLNLEDILSQEFFLDLI